MVSYDIKYGPREQITDGVDGFLTPAGDLETFADRVVRMIRDPDLVASMSTAALAKAQLHDYRAFLRDWRSALESAVANKPGRVAPRPRRPARHSPRTRAGPAGCRVGWYGRAPGQVPSRPHPRSSSRARSTCTAGARPETLDAVKVTMDAVCDATGAVTILNPFTRVNYVAAEQTMNGSWISRLFTLAGALTVKRTWNEETG